MSELIELTALMPCLNEAATLATCINKAKAYLDQNGISGEVLVADNGSTDGSQEIARSLGARIVEVPPRGYGSALWAGIGAARGRYVIMGDADDSYDFGNLIPFLHALRNGADLVMGNRFAGGIAAGAMPFLHRYLGNPVLTLIGQCLFRVDCGDFHCGLRGISRDRILSLNLLSPGMEFASEMVIRAAVSGLRIVEDPTTLAKDGRSRPPHLRTWQDGWRHLRLLLVLRYRGNVPQPRDMAPAQRSLENGRLSPAKLGLVMQSTLIAPPLECTCAGNLFELAHRYTEPPAGEIRFAFSAESGYRREIQRCTACGHFVSTHNMNTSGMYSGEYVSATYGSDNGLLRNFERIIGLDPARSDNNGRVRRVIEFAAGHFTVGKAAPRILDVGSGLCVFLYRMKEAGWQCTALDPDPRSAQHARETVGVDAICGDFMLTADLGLFDVISFNKVLEHVESPVAMLRKAGLNLEQGGFIYIELPDGEAAQTEGFGREEFFIDHPHIFSAASFASIVERAQLRLLTIERVREPSTKFTLRGFVGLAV